MPTPLDYARPISSAPPLRAPLLKLVVFPLIAVLALAGYVHVGASIAQRSIGTVVLFKPATGTHIYDVIFIVLPWTAATAVLIVVALKRRQTWWCQQFSYWITYYLFLWLLFVLLCLGKWDEISP